jgi:Auxiliary Activity family 9 (formerly GH61)
VKNSTVKKEPVFVTLPDDVSQGGYLIRHEIIALQLAVSVGGAEFYPSCIQILVGGSKTGTPNQTVSFPGAYNDNDPGIYDPTVYDQGSPYVFPGPPVSNLASPDSGTGTDVSSGSPATNGPTKGSGTTAGNEPTSTNGSGGGTGPTSRPSSSGAICKLKKRDTSLTRRGTDFAHHRHRVGFMRAIRDAFHHS